MHIKVIAEGNFLENEVKMRKLVILLVILGSLGGIGGLALAASTDTTSVAVEVQVINEIAVSGNPSPLVINTATAGLQPDDQVDNYTTYALSTNGTNIKVTGRIDSAMPSNTHLEIQLAAPSGGSSQGAISMTTADQDLVTGIAKAAESSLGITYTFGANIQAGIVSSSQKTVTFTLTQ